MHSGTKPKMNCRAPGENAFLILMICLFLAGSVTTIRLTDFGSASAAVNFFLSLVALLFTILLYSFCIFGFTWDVREKHSFSILVFAFFLHELASLLVSGIEDKPGLYRLIMLVYTLQYLFSSLYWLAFWFFQKGKYQHRFGEKNCKRICFAFFSVYALVTLVNYFTGFCFTVEPDGSFVMRSPLLLDLTLLWFVLYFMIIMTAQCNRKTKLTLASYSLFPMLSWLTFLFPRYRDFFLSIFSGLAALFYLIPLYLLFFNIYLENGQLFLQRERELELSRANAMMLKISPHFIANTMSSIVALCDCDAAKAGELASQFAVYLRDNYADMSEDEMIPFSAELGHIRNYLAIEEVRFPGLQVEYDIQAKDFLLPTLTVQPLVENAVRHGISKRPDASGTVKITSLEEENSYIIRIADDGVGFHPTEHKDGKHIGISNAKARLHMLCTGTLTVTSQYGQGTVCEIRIPKGVART